MSFILNVRQIKDVSLEQINGMKCNSFHYCIRALECSVEHKQSSQSADAPI